MKNKIIFELKLNSKDSIIAYEKKDYETCYEDSLLYVNINGKRTKVVENSFCYGFGAEMYYRVHNVYDFDENSNFAELYADCLSNATYDEEWLHSRGSEICNNYDFANGKSSDVFIQLFLLKNKNTYRVLLVNVWEIKPRKYAAKILNEFQISKSIFAEWKSLICSEWEKRVVIEGEKIAEANSRPKSTKEEWEQYFLSMRTEE